MPSDTYRLYGTEEPPRTWQTLRAGALSVQWADGWLRHIRWGADEVWYGVGFVLRDAHWGTPQPQMRGVDLRQDGTTFEVSAEGVYTAPAGLHDGLPATFAEVTFRIQVRGDARGWLHVDVQAEAGADVRVNRLGLCLLHPSDAAGARVEVRHGDGRRSVSSFPVHIPPWPPFTLVRALRHEWRAGQWATATLDGDVFETEDQRNNADACFKTYSRSNLAPRPYCPGAWGPIHQSATLALDGPAAPTAAPDGAGTPGLRVTVGADAGAWPSVGLEIDGDDVDAVRGKALQRLAPAHLHLVWRPGAQVHWATVGAMLRDAGVRLRLDLLLPDEVPTHTGAMQALASELHAHGIVVEALAVFPSTLANIRAARAAFAGRPVGGGTPHFFVQLSRLDALGEVDFASFTTASVVHGTDEDDIMDGLSSLPAMVDTWRARHPSVPLRIGPSDIGARSSPLGAQPHNDGRRRQALAQADPRSRAQFGAAWVLGHLAGLARPGVASISVRAPCVARGRPTDPEGDGDDSAVLHPSSHVLAALGRPATRLDVEISAPGRLAAVALRRDDRLCVLVANLRADPVDVEVDVPGEGAWETCLRLDACEDAAPQWRPQPLGHRRLHLPAYAVAQLEGRRGGPASARP